ncbi:hypothetical protein Q7P35_005982 [Cladosporium inversicolor]
MILFVCTPVPSQANLEDYYHVLKRLHKCEDIDVPLQAGVQLLRSNIPPVGGGVLVLRGMGVLGLLQYRHTPIRPQCTEIRTKEGILSVLCVRHFTAGDSQGARTSIVSLSDQSVSAGRDDLVQSTTIVSPSDRPVSAGREGMVQSTTTPSPSDRQLGRLPLLGLRDSNNRFDDQKPGASLSSIGRSLEIVSYTKHDDGSLGVGPTRRRDHEPPQRYARTLKA